jgi:hypothetical protein
MTPKKGRKKGKKARAVVAMQQPRGKIVEVVWMDAALHERIPKLDLTKLEEFLVESHTFGKLVAEDEKVMLVATHMNRVEGADILAIPKGWIKEVNVQKGG